jgi:hypothetical protein
LLVIQRCLQRLRIYILISALLSLASVSNQSRAIWIAFSALHFFFYSLIIISMIHFDLGSVIKDCLMSASQRALDPSINIILADISSIQTAPLHNNQENQY